MLRILRKVGKYYVNGERRKAGTGKAVNLFPPVTSKTRRSFGGLGHIWFSGIVFEVFSGDLYILFHITYFALLILSGMTEIKLDNNSTLPDNDIRN